MKLQIILCVVVFVVVGAVLLAWNAVDVGTEKKKVSEGHYMMRGFVLGYVVCALVFIVAQLIV